MQAGVFAKTFRGTDPATVLAAAKTAGFDLVQYNMACSGLSSLPLEVTADVATAIAAAAADQGVQIAAVSATYNMVHPSPERREQGRRAAAAIAGHADLIGTRLMTLCSGSADPIDQWRHHPENASPSSWRQLLREFEYLVQLAERYDLVLCVEPESANVVSSAPAARLLVDTLRTDRVGIILDPANLFEVADAGRRQYLIEEAVDLLADRIVLAHAKDRYPDGTVAPAGEGIIDFDHFLRSLRAGGFDGPLIAHGFEEPDAAAVAAFLNSHLRQLEPVA